MKGNVKYRIHIFARACSMFREVEVEMTVVLFHIESELTKQLIQTLVMRAWRFQAINYHEHRSE